MTKMKKGKKKSTMKVSLLKPIFQITSTVRQDTVGLIENISEFVCKIDLARVEILEGMVRDLGHLSKHVGEAMEETIIDLKNVTISNFLLLYQPQIQQWSSLNKLIVPHKCQCQHQHQHLQLVLQVPWIFIHLQVQVQVPRVQLN